MALRDELAGVTIAIIKVHLSTPHTHESFRHHRYFGDLAVGVVCGLGADGYLYAMNAEIHRLST